MNIDTPKEAKQLLWFFLLPVFFHILKAGLTKTKQIKH